MLISNRVRWMGGTEKSFFDAQNWLENSLKCRMAHWKFLHDGFSLITQAEVVEKQSLQINFDSAAVPNLLK